MDAILLSLGVAASNLSEPLGVPGVLLRAGFLASRWSMRLVTSVVLPPSSRYLLL